MYHTVTQVTMQLTCSRQHPLYYWGHVLAALLRHHLIIQCLLYS